MITKMKNKFIKNNIIYTKYLIGIFLFCVFLFPLISFAQCDDNGVTVVYINGIFTPTRELANIDKNLLSDKYVKKFGISNNVTFITGYNPSHIAGLGDLIESASQIINHPVSDYDFKTILAQIHLEINTKKIVLVGYSQGSLYSNEIYNYLINNGVSKESIAVYNIATPASYVSENGNYITSKNDKVINSIRDLAIKLKASQPLPWTIDIPLSKKEEKDSSGGHSFSESYLAKGSDRISADIKTALDNIAITENQTLPEQGCFNLPDQNFLFKAQKVAFLVTDPLANGTVAVYEVGKDTVVYTGEKIVSTSVFVVDSAQKTAIFVADKTQEATIFIVDKTQEVAITVAKTTNKIIDTTNIKVKNIYNNIASLEKPIAKIEPNIVVNNNVLSLNQENKKTRKQKNKKSRNN
ncbi:MAG: hypothetical protein AAB530_00805 [Patescibacteria group bacterium]